MPKSNALELLRNDHREMRALFQRLDRGDAREQAQICQDVIAALKLHTHLEDEVFYPYVRETTGQADLLEEATVEHSAAENLLRELETGDRDPMHQRAVLKVLAEYLGHHIREEEEKMFPIVAKTGVDLEALGLELLERREALEGQGRRASRGGSKARSRSGRDTRAADQRYMEKHGDGLSRSTQRAKWIHAPGEHAEHPGQTLATRNPEVIRQWAEARKARPATSPGGDPERPRVLRFDFPEYDRGLQPVSWEAWLHTFEQRQLVFLFQEQMKAGNQSNFFRLDHPEREDG